MVKDVKHIMERKAFEKGLESIINKGQEKDLTEVMLPMINMLEKILGDAWEGSSYELLRKLAKDPNSKWTHYTQNILRNVDPHILKTFALNAGYESGFRGYKTSLKMSERYQCNIPWIILMDPTTACNMHCTGCWAAEYGDKMNLSFEDMDRIITEGKELGIHAFLFTGGEPLIKKKEIIRLCEKHSDCAFHAFTNGSIL